MQSNKNSTRGDNNNHDGNGEGGNGAGAPSSSPLPSTGGTVVNLASHRPLRSQSLSRVASSPSSWPFSSPRHNNNNSSVESEDRPAVPEIPARFLSMTTAKPSLHALHATQASSAHNTSKQLGPPSPAFANPPLMTSDPHLPNSTPQSRSFHHSASTLQIPATATATAAGENAARPSLPPSIKRTASARETRPSSSSADVLTRPKQGQRFLAPAHQRSKSASPISRRPPPLHQDVQTLSKLESRSPSTKVSTTTTTTTTTMARERLSRNNQEDLFLELADEEESLDVEEDTTKHPRRSEIRLSTTASKRRSLPPDALGALSGRRPSTSSNAYARPSSRLHANRASADLQDQYRSTTHRNSAQYGDTASVSGLSTSGRSRRFSMAHERSPISPSTRPRSPELQQHPRGRPQFGAISALRHNLHSSSRTFDSHDESPSESIEGKHTESASTESQTPDTVWDELDELKSRINKLESTGTVPTTSSAAISGDSSERPRTATTAPTTIDSSPKHQRNKTIETKETPTQPAEGATGTVTSSDTLHQPLHSALAKARPLLNSSLYRTLEATANDALQLAAMMGSSLPGTNGNGPLVSDRQARRKADSMCRNLTDLCLALCEGKHEAPSILSSPASMDTVTQPPSLRYSSSSLGQRAASIGRPISRLEARRSHILGVPSTMTNESVSPRGSIGDMSGSEQEMSPVHHPQQQLRRVSRTPSNLRSRLNSHDDISGEDEPTLRPPSRAMTDIGALRKLRTAPDDRSGAPQRTPSLRESLAARRNNEATYEYNRETSRISSFSGDLRRRRLIDQQSTPPVVEEESPSEYETPSQPRRRLTSMGHFSSRRGTGEFPGRAASLSQRRQVIAE